MKTVVLYGELANRFGKYHRLSVRTPAEAIRALKANHKGFERFMCEAHRNNIGFRLFVGTKRVQAQKIDEIHYPMGHAEVIRMVPVIVGSGGWVRVLIGVVLVAAAVTIGVLSAGGFGSVSISLGTAGLGLIIGGAMQLLTTPPKDPTRDDPDKKTSYIFNGPANTSAQGRAVPVGYGRMIVGSAVISAGIETHEE